MELITLDSSFQPKNLVEDYSSLIWTERYGAAGDFELKTGQVESTINALPLESCLSLRESTVPMIVEAHKIEKKSGAAAVLTVVGRSFETVLERRVAIASLPDAAVRPVWTIAAAKESDAAFFAIRKVLGDVARSGLSATTPLVPEDAIAEISLTIPADLSLLTPNTYEIKAADLYNAVMDLLTVNHHGIKSVRPLPGGNQIAVEIYNGADLTNSLVFDAKFDQFDSATYLLSQQGSANVAYVSGSTGNSIVLKTAAPTPSGLSRRVLLVDDASDTNVTTAEIRTNRGLIELYKNNATALFDGQVAQQVAAGYNTAYFLGDILRLDGEYGLSENVRVAEFIRTSDATGDKAYPAFDAVI